MFHLKYTPYICLIISHMKVHKFLIAALFKIFLLISCSILINMVTVDTQMTFRAKKTKLLNFSDTSWKFEYCLPFDLTFYTLKCRNLQV